MIEDQEEIYLIMEAMKGGSLFDLITKYGGALTENEVIHIME